jgi:hypothetical protein
MHAGLNHNAQGWSGSSWMNSNFGSRSQHNSNSHGFSLTGNHSGSSTGWRDQPTFPLTSNHTHSAQSLVGPRTSTPQWWEAAQASTTSAWRTDDRLMSSTQSSSRLGSSWTGSSLWGNNSFSSGGNSGAGGTDLRGGFSHFFNGGKSDAGRSSPLWSQNWRQVWPEVSARVSERTSRNAATPFASQPGSQATSTASSHPDRTSPLWTSLISGRTKKSTTPSPSKPTPPPVPKSVTPQPAPKPVAPKPVAPQPVPPKPVAPQPAPPKPAAPQPVAPQPAPPKPVETAPPSPPVPTGPVQTPPPVETTPPVVVQPPPALSAQQRADLTELHRIATSGRVTSVEQQAANAIYGRFRLDNTTLAELQDTARTVAGQLLTPANADFAKATREWGSYGPEQRQEVLARFVGALNDTLGLDVEVRFFNTPPVNGRTTHGFFSTGTNSLNLNTNPASINSFAFAVKTAFHEMIHAQYFDKTKGLKPDTALAKVNSGEIDFTTAMVYFNALPGLYLTTPQVTRTEYMLNPHEQLAFTGQYFWENEAAARGLTDSSPTFTGANPLFEHLRNNRFA